MNRSERQKEVAETCGAWGQAEFGPAYCNAKPGHQEAHRYRAATGTEFVVTLDHDHDCTCNPKGMCDCGPCPRCFKEDAWP